MIPFEDRTQDLKKNLYRGEGNIMINVIAVIVVVAVIAVSINFIRKDLKK